MNVSIKIMNARNKISLNQLFWSQASLIPKDFKFFYIAPNDSFATFTWYESGNMRGSSGIENIKLNNPFRFSTDEKKLRGEIITVGSYLELIIEGLLYINVGVYHPEKKVSQKRVNQTMSDKVEKRLRWLNLQEVISSDICDVTLEFFRFRNKVAHSYTFKDLTYRGELMNKQNWDEVSAKIVRDYEKLISGLLTAYYQNQRQLIDHVFSAIKKSQKDGVNDIHLSEFWMQNITINDVDIREVKSIDEVVDFGINSFYKNPTLQ